MVVEKAKKHFRGKERYNCAQAILKAFEDTHDVPQELINSFRGFGGGRADRGLCGALFAAMHLAKDSDMSDKIEQEFEKIAGSAKCRPIRKSKTVSCEKCVVIAARILDDLSRRTAQS